MGFASQTLEMPIISGSLLDPEHSHSLNFSQLNVLIATSDTYEAKLLSVDLTAVAPVIHEITEESQLKGELESFQPDLIFLSSHFSDLSSLARICNQIRTNPYGKKAKLVVIADQQSSVRDCMESKSDLCMVRPFTKRDVLSHVERLLSLDLPSEHEPAGLKTSHNINLTNHYKLKWSGLSDKERSALFLLKKQQLDSVTGLFGRDALDEYLKAVYFEQVKTQSSPSVFVSVEVTSLHLVVESCGYLAGEELMRCAAATLLNATKDTQAFLTRFKGTTLGLVLSNMRPNEINTQADQIRSAFRSQVFNYAGRSFTVDVSVLLHEISPHASTVDQLLQKNLDSWSDPEELLGQEYIKEFKKPEASEELQGNRNAASAILKAIEDESFEVHFQRLLGLTGAHAQTDKLKFEALVRMKAEDGSLIYPDFFIATAERLRLISHIDRWVIKDVVRFFSHNPELMSKTISIAINLSAVTLLEVGLAEYIEDVCKRYGVNPSMLVFELTETQSIKNAEQARQVMATIKRLGCRFSLDDFGTGYASFTFMRELPFDLVKIDGAFVRDLQESAFHLTMVKSIVEIAHSIGAAVVAEYVENEEIIEHLQAMEVDWGQGYAIHRPERMTTDLFYKWDE